uniref:DNA polymerase delta subunit 4 n=1 Tax=Pyxicephalus adspersus TaxID=30357 RepID=A0AAV2ZVI3_PYXAD|nr:TPA: hypothetical protein GDO54_015326 [Pyxicephalus adspersus]
MIMARKRKLTDCLPIVKQAKQGDPLRKVVEQPQPGGSKAKSKTLKSEKQDAEDTAPLEKLVKFDLDWQFGPCTGITRMERWQRAQDLGLRPPQDIKQILLTHSADPQYQHKYVFGG